MAIGTTLFCLNDCSLVQFIYALDRSIRKKLWGEALWSPSYFAGSCGGAPISIIRQYIEQQQTPS
jgi:REP element-mobilizing transposase RayT